MFRSFSAKLLEVRELTPKEKLFTLRFIDPHLNDGFTYKPGQFVMVDLRGFGEFPISICSTPTRKGYIQLCVRKAGRLTKYMHELREGDVIGIRGPYGNGFPMEIMEKSKLLLVSGGLGMAPLRSVLWYALDSGKYAEIRLFYGTRSYEDILFKDEILNLLQHGQHMNCYVKLSYEIDSPHFSQLKSNCPRSVCKGLVTDLFEGEELDAENTYAIVCGPPVMYKFVVKELLSRNFSPGRIYMTLERRMRCGVGKCGHCIVGTSRSIKYVCKDGPVFTYWDALSTRGLIE